MQIKAISSKQIKTIDREKKGLCAQWIDFGSVWRWLSESVVVSVKEAEISGRRPRIIYFNGTENRKYDFAVWRQSLNFCWLRTDVE